MRLRVVRTWFFVSVQMSSLPFWLFKVAISLFLFVVVVVVVALLPPLLFKLMFTSLVEVYGQQNLHLRKIARACLLFLVECGQV
jgi:hypothetical protein